MCTNGPDVFGFQPLQAKMTPSVELARAVMRDRFRPIKAPKNIIEQPQCDPKVSWVDLLELTDDVAPPGFPCTSFRTTCPGAAADGERKQSMEVFLTSRSQKSAAKIHVNPSKEPRLVQWQWHHLLK